MTEAIFADFRKKPADRFSRDRQIQKKRALSIEGCAYWGSAGEDKWMVIRKKEMDTPSDVTMSTERLYLKINQPLVQGFQITCPEEKQSSIADFQDRFIKNLRTFVTNQGCGFNRLPLPYAFPALPAPKEQIVINESFEGLIDDIKDNVAFVTLIDNAGNKSYVNIPCEELQKSKIECRPGNIFSFVFKRWGDLETAEYKPIIRPVITQEEFDKWDEDYHKKYGDE